jgi:type II secretory ATPase GspE/PulE/Tfp pilus assembly ATPase PilB-like protein
MRVRWRVLGERMVFDPIVATTIVEGGGYISILKIVPPLILLLIWARMLTWADKDAHAAHLPRLPLNAGFTSGMAVGFALFFLLPTFIIAFATLFVVFGVEAGVYLFLRNQKVGLADLKVQFNAWLKGFSKGKSKKEQKEIASQVSVIGKGGNAMPVPEGAEDPNRPAFEAIQAALTEPLRKGAELITLAPSEQGLGVRYQVDGMEYKGQMLEKTTGAAAISLLKGAAGLDVEDRRKPQRTMVKLVVDGKRREYRLETAGSTAGEAARFLLDPKKRYDIRLESLGFNQRQLGELNKLIKEDRRGIVIVAAPKTMGMTSAMYAIMRGHDAFLEHLHTIERDPDSEIEGITQNKLAGNASGSDELKVVDWVISQEPDGILIPRVDDPRTANALVKFAKEKRVYVGIRAGSTFEALNQWRKLVGNDKLAAENLRMVIAGRVLRKLCMACKISYAPDPGVVKKLNLNPEKAATLFQARTQPLRDPKGNPVPCDFCLDLRSKGRIGVYEMLVVDDDVRSVIGAGGSENQLKAVFRKQRGKYLQEEGLGLVEAGETSVQEVLRVLKIDGGGAGGGGGGGERAPAPRSSGGGGARGPSRAPAPAT